MDLSRSEYPALLASLQPAQAVTVLNDRVKTIERINGDVAEWLAERRRLEETYGQGLRRLAARRPESMGNFGVFQTPWRSILSSCDSLAESHQTLAKKILIDVEKPLREYQKNNREMSGITTIQGNLAALAKEVEESQRKSEKVIAKGNKADSSKLTGALNSVQEAQQQWESQAPFVFEQLQALDEGRINHLRDVLTQLQTHEVDQMERSRGIAESTLNSLLNVDTSEEISAFVARTSNGLPNLSSPRRQSRISVNRQSISSAPGDAPAGLVPPVPEIPSALAAPSPSLDDGRSERSAAISAEARRSDAGMGAPPPPEKQKKGRLGGLRSRMGTVIGRGNKEPKAASAASPEKRPKPSRNPLRRGSSSRNNMYQLESPNTSMTELADTSERRLRQTRSPNRAPSSALEDNSPATNGHVNGAALANGSSMGNGSVALQEAPAQERKARPPSTIQEEGQGQGQDGRPAPSSVIDDITRAQQEAAATEGEQPQFKVDIRKEPITEDGDPDQALSQVANTLRAGVVPPARRGGTVRGRRDVRNTIFVPNPSNTPPPQEVMPFAPPPTSQPTETPIGMPPSRSSTLAPFSPVGGGGGGSGSQGEHRGSDAQSVRSATSLSSLSHGVVRHPEMHERGLNASVVETVSAWFSEGRVTKAIAIGEMALVNNSSADGSSNTSKSEKIRLENFSVLEKVAPNPTFITQQPSKPGEYSVDLSALSPRSAVAFKYQLHLDESNLAAHAPVLLTPSWKVEPTQISVILTYAFNSAFAASSVSLQNVVVMITIEGARSTSCLSKPVGSFSKEKNLIYWKLGDLTLTSENEGVGQQQQQKLLARFATESEARPGTVEAKWEIVGEAAAGVGSGLALSRDGSSSSPTANPTNPTTTTGDGEDSDRAAAAADPFADEGNNNGPVAAAVAWTPVPVVRKLMSGRYIATSSSATPSTS